MKQLFLLLAFLLPLSAHAGGLGAQATAHGVNLTWTASATPGSTVNVYRCSGVSCTSFTKLTSGVTPSGPYLDTTAAVGSYSYYVTAVVGGAESAPSNTTTVTVLPQPPTGLSSALQ